MRLNDKVAIITASGSGMGRAAAEIFAREGAKVVVADLSSEKGEETVDIIKQGGGEASFIKVDVSDIASVKDMINFTVNKYGRIDILYNHAGIPGPGGIDDVNEEEWDKAMAINVKGGFFATKFAVPEMRKQGRGSIIFTGSTSGIVGSLFSASYSAGKGAVVNMTRGLAIKLAPEGIRVNCICPGPIETPMLPQFVARPGEEHLQEENMKKLAGGVPLGRVGKPEEIGYTALFLASDEASFITGAIIPVDGGFTAR